MIDVSAIMGMASKALSKVEAKGAMPEMSACEMPDGALRITLSYGDSHAARCSADADAMSKLQPMGKKFASAEQADRAMLPNGMRLTEIRDTGAIAPTAVMGADCHFLFR